MITQNEFDKAQILLGRKGKQRAKLREFSFTGMIRCGECDSMVTAEEKLQVRCTSCKYKFSCNNKRNCPKCQISIAEMQSPNILHYIFYRCTKKNRTANCEQRYVRLEYLERQIDDLLARIEIPESFKEWAIQYLNELHDKEATDQTTVAKSIETAYQDCLERINNLVKLKISPMNSDGSVLSDEDFKAQMTPLKKERKEIEQKLTNLGERIDQWLELSQKTFKFACYARVRFQHETFQGKKEILSALGSNFIIHKQKLSLSVPKPFIAIRKVKIETDRIIARLEPREKADMKAQMMYLYAQNDILRRGRDSNSR